MTEAIEDVDFTADNEFFKQMLNLLPPIAYFDKDVKEQLKSNKESEGAERNGAVKEENRKSKKSKKHKKGKQEMNPFLSKSVTQIQEDLLRQTEENFTGVKSKKKKEENTQFIPSTTPIASCSTSVDDNRSKIRSKIEQLQAKRKANDDETTQEMKRQRRKEKKEAKKLKKKQKRREKNTTNNFTHKGDHSVQTKTPNKPIYNSEGNLVFSKFDFTASGKKKRNSDLTGKDYKRLLEKVEKRNEKLNKLKNKDESIATNLQEKFKWDAALHKAEGEKVKDNPELLKKALKRKEKIKEKKKKKWEERTKNVEKQKQEKQNKRTKNINARKQAKKENKIKKLQKKGRLIPGF